MNVCALVGRLGNDPEMRYTPSGTAITKFRMAVDRQKKTAEGEKETDWLDIVTFGVVAENCGQYLQKGSPVAVEGQVQSRTWDDNQGQKRYSVEIIGNRVQFLESKKEADARRAGGDSDE